MSLISAGSISLDSTFKVTCGLLYVHKIIYAPMIYTSLYVMMFDPCSSITRASGKGLGLEILSFWPKMALAYRLDAISQGPKNS